MAIAKTDEKVLALAKRLLKILPQQKLNEFHQLLSGPGGKEAFNKAVHDYLQQEHSTIVARMDPDYVCEHVEGTGAAHRFKLDASGKVPGDVAKAIVEGAKVRPVHSLRGKMAEDGQILKGNAVKY